MHACGHCGGTLFSGDFVGHAAADMDAALGFHLRRACVTRPEDDLRAVIARGGPIDVVLRDARPAAKGDAPLAFCARHSLDELAMTLLERGVPASELDATDRFGCTALHHAAARGCVRLAEALVARGAHVDARTADSVHAHVGDRTPLHLVALTVSPHALDLAAVLLRARADPRARDADGLTPLQLARPCGAAPASALALQLSEAASAVAGNADASADERAGPHGSDGSDSSDDESAMPHTSAAVRSALSALGQRERRRLRLDVTDRPLLRGVHVLRGVWERGVCEHVLGHVLRVARTRGWQSARHAHHPTVDMPVWRVPAVHALVLSTLERRVLPGMERLFELAPGALRVKEAFFIKYEAAPEGSERGRCQPGLELHRDGTLFSCNVHLNGGAAADGSFAGGGTFFAHTGETVCEPAGDFVVHCGQMLHGAVCVTAGVRYVLVAFVDEKRRPDE